MYFNQSAKLLDASLDRPPSVLPFIGCKASAHDNNRLPNLHVGVHPPRNGIVKFISKFWDSFHFKVLRPGTRSQLRRRPDNNSV